MTTAPIASRFRATLLGVLVALCALTLAALAVGAALQARTSHVVEAQKLQLRDSAVAVVVGFERQFLRLRSALGRTAVGRPADDLLLHYDLLVSRIELLKGAVAVEGLRQRADYAALVQRLDVLVAEGDRRLQDGTLDVQDATVLLRQVDALVGDVQAFTTIAVGLASDLIASQFELLRDQALTIGALAALQLVLLVVAASAVWWRQRQQARNQRQLEALAGQLQQAKSAAEAAAQAKGQFLANMSHELRTPFQGVLGMLHLLEGSGLDSAQAGLVRTARGSANHLLALLNDILDLSAIEAGRLVLQEEPFDLQRLCAEVAGLMRVPAEDKGLALVLQQATPGPLWLNGDATRIRQILFNLLHNAIKFTPSGQVRLAVAVQPQADGQVQLQFEVSDTGIGMDAAMQARLFQRFEPGDNRMSRRHGGTGLGLEISRNLARRMGGDLVASSQPGQGSQFRVTLQLRQALPPARPQPVRPLPASRPLNVLVVDDQPINREFLGQALAMLGHRSTECANGAEALQRVQADWFDAVLMDLHMPVLDGVAATAAIRAMGGPHARLPILALTADVLTDVRERASAAGVSAFLAKPVAPDQLAAALATVTAQPGAPSPPPAIASAPADPRPRWQQVARELPPGKLRELLERFYAGSSGPLWQLREAFASADPATIRAAAHGLRGAAAMLGLDAVAAAAARVEAWADQGAPAAAAAGVRAAVEAAAAETRRQLPPDLAP